MKEEIDLRSLLVGHLHCDTHDIRPYNIFSNKEINIIERPLDTFREWNREEQTSYIESIFLHCSLQPIIRFVNEEHTVIVDGWNRYMTILNFCNNKLVLQERGLKQLKFLAGKNFEKLDDDERDYFKKCDPIKFFDYHYQNSMKNLTKDEEYEIIRYLHFIYNIGLRLELEEMQKAQFCSEYITNLIREKINTDFDYLNKLEELKLFNGKKKRNKIDNILLNCRLLIASTYSNIEQFSSARNIQERIEENYLPNLMGRNEQKVYQDFEFIINLIYEKLVSTQKWQLYPEIHTKPFIDATYWLLSVIKKDNLGDPLQFDFIQYLEYFGKKEVQEQLFNSKQSHFQKNILKRYQAVAQYFEEISGKSLSTYFSSEKRKTNSVGTISNIEELYNNHFSFSIYKIKISTLLEETKSTNYCIRPYYQREEMLNILLSSKLIESILLGFVIPYLLLYDKYENGKIITEVVDGQQRILSILALFLSPFCNSQGDLEYSKKNGYALKGLKILSELNGKKVNAQEAKNKLTEKTIQKILNTELYVSKTTDEKNINFSAVDHFIRLNKNAFTIKENTYRMWTLTADKTILDFEKSITEKYQEDILPRVNQKRVANMITMKLACFIFYKKIKTVFFHDFSNNKVSLWLNSFNSEKDKYLFSQPDVITENRNSYLKAFKETEEFYEKVHSFLEKTNQTIHELFHLKKSANFPSTSYYYLYVLIGEISKEDLIENSIKINTYLQEFFEKIRKTKMRNEEIFEHLNFASQQISIFDTCKKNEFREKIKSLSKDL